jgi:hypothetical protein
MTSRALLVALCLATLPACSAYVTRIDHGGSYASGTSDFDELFDATGALEGRVGELAAARQAAVEKLAKALGASAEGDTSDVLLALGGRAKKLQAAGVLLHLTLTPEPKVLASGGEAPPEGADQAALEAVETAGKEAIPLFVKGYELAAEVRALRGKREALASRVGASFPDESKRQEVVAELGAAEKVLAERQKGAEYEAGQAAALLVGMARVLETGGSAEPPPPPKKKPRNPGPAGPAKPKPKPAGDDFEP